MSYINDSHKKAVIQSVERQLKQRDYHNIKPMRLSYETINSAHLNYQAQMIYQGEVGYQGLTKASFDNQDCIVKWQLRSVATRQPTSLDAEIFTIKRLQQTFSQWPSRLLDYELLIEDKTTVNDQLYRFNGLVMPFFELGSLKSYVADHSLSAQSKLQLATNIAQSIQQLHHAGWVHGDLKPSNFLLSQTNPIFSQLDAQSSVAGNNTELVTYLNDLAYARPFGIACQSSNTSSLDQHSNSARIFGTPAYLAPECWHGQPISIASDLYAFGISLFELFAEQKPYSIAENLGQAANSDALNSVTVIIDQSAANAWARLHCQKPIPLLPYQWHKLQPIIDKLLAKRIQNRYQSIDEAIQALQMLKNSA